MSEPVGGFGRDFFEETFGDKLGSIDRLTALMIETLRKTCPQDDIKRFALDARISEESPIQFAISNILQRATIETIKSVASYLNDRLDSLNKIDPDTALPEVKEIIELAKKLSCPLMDLKLNKLNEDLIGKISSEIVNLRVLDEVLKGSTRIEDVSSDGLTEIFVIMLGQNNMDIFSKLSDSYKTEEIWLAILSVNGGDWLRYVPEDDRTEKICRLVVAQNGLTLQYVPNAHITKEICILAVRQNGNALQFVPEDKRTEEICALAVRQNGYALQDIPEHKRTEEICALAVRQDGYVLQFVPEDKRTEEICTLAVTENGYALEFVREDKRTEEICALAVRQNGYTVRFVPEDKRTEEIYTLAVTQNGGALENVPEDKRTEEICALAVRQNGYAFQFVPEDKKTARVCIAALEKNPNLYGYVPKNNQDKEVLALLKPIYCEIVKSDLSRAFDHPLLFRDPDFISSLFNIDIMSLDRDIANDLRDLIRKAYESNTEIIKAIPYKYIKGELITATQFPISIAEEIRTLSLSLAEGGSLESLFSKLLAYADSVKPEAKAVIELARERVFSNSPFFGSPRQDEKEILDGWYHQLKLLLQGLDTAIDADPSKDQATKDELIEAFGTCGGGWQGRLEEMNSRLVSFRGATPRAMIGIVVKRLVDEIVNQIHMGYSAFIGIDLDVHHLNAIRNFLKDYIPEVVLPDHLASIAWSQDRVRWKFLYRFTPENIVKAIKEEYIKEDSALQEALLSLYQEQIFRGSKSTPAIDEKIRELRVHLQSLLDVLPANIESYNTILEKIKPEDRKAFMDAFNQPARAPMISHKLKKPEYDGVIHEHIGDIFQFKGIQREISQLAGIPLEDVLTKSAEEIMKAFEEARGSKVDGFVIEEFENLHTVDGRIQDSGIQIIAQKLGLIKLQSWLGLEDFDPLTYVAGDGGGASAAAGLVV